MSQELTSAEALSYLAEIIDAARAGGAPREHIQALQLAREALGEEIEFTCFVGDPHRVKTCPYVDRLEDLEAENDELKEKLKDSFQGRLLNKLKKKDAKIAQAMAILNVSNSVDSMVEHIQSQPAVDPIRAAGGCYCRECVHWIGDIRAPYGNEKHGHCEVWLGSGCEMCMDADDFCSYGEPKKEGGR